MGKYFLATTHALFIKPQVHNKKHAHHGFTLIELIVVIGMLSILFLVAISVINPIGQINKGKDAVRQHDLQQVKTALDTYYNDHGCYPTAVPFNAAWKEGNNIYMQTVPQDATCDGKTQSCYTYQVDNTSACPQWDVLYGELVSSIVKSPSQILCPLTSLTNCLPKNYASSGYNFCLLSGNVDCAYIAQSNLPTPMPTAQPTPTSGPPPPTGQPTPTPTPTPPACDLLYACVLDNTTNKTVCNSVCDPLHPSVCSRPATFCGSKGCTGNACCSNACNM